MTVRRTAGLVLVMVALSSTVASCGESAATKLKNFCTAVTDDATTPAVAANDDAATVKTKLAQAADALSEIASKAPSDIKDDAKSVADAAKSVADAVTSSATVQELAAQIKKLSANATSEASTRISKFVAESCGAQS